MSTMRGRNTAPRVHIDQTSPIWGWILAPGATARQRLDDCSANFGARLWSSPARARDEQLCNNFPVSFCHHRPCHGHRNHGPSLVPLRGAGLAFSRLRPPPTQFLGGQNLCRLGGAHLDRGKFEPVRWPKSPRGSKVHRALVEIALGLANFAERNPNSHHNQCRALAGIVPALAGARSESGPTLQHIGHCVGPRIGRHFSSTLAPESPPIGSTSVQN